MYCDIPDFGRCCFCLPLRRGVLVFGYLNVILHPSPPCVGASTPAAPPPLFSAFMVGLYSYCVKHCESNEFKLIYKGYPTDSVAGVCIALYCIEVIVNCLLVYGAHEKKTVFLKLFYYYAVTTTLAGVVLQVVELTRKPHNIFEMGVLAFTGLCIQLYLIFLVRSLLKKLETGDGHSYDNQLHMIVSGETKMENGVYNNTTTAPVPDV